MLAKANYEHNLQQTRVSSHALWEEYNIKIHNRFTGASEAMIQNATVVDGTEQADGSNPVHSNPINPQLANELGLVRMKQFVPSSVIPKGEIFRRYQVLLFTMEGILRVGVVEEVFRGAIKKPSKKSTASKAPVRENSLTRKMKSTKPFAYALRTANTAKLKIAQLESVNDAEGLWITSCCHPHYSLDPFNSEEEVYGEFTPVKVISEYPTLRLQLIRNTQATIDRFAVASGSLEHLNSCVMLLWNHYEPFSEDVHI